MTVTRLVLIRLAEAHIARGPEIAGAAREMFPDIPGVQSIEAGVVVDGEDHVVLLVRFASLDDVEPYRVHPVHVQFVEEFVAPYNERLHAQNFI